MGSSHSSCQSSRNSQKKVFVKERGKMIVIVTAHHLQIRARPLITASKPKQHLDFILSLIHILMFYTLLLASITWYEKYLSWILQLTSWTLMANCYFYAALLYVNNAKNPFLTLKKQTVMRILSKFLTIVYVMNMSLTYYFLLDVYPKLKGLDAYRQLVIYMYPGLSVLINLIIDFSYTKSLHFRGLGSSVILVSLYIAIIGILRNVFNVPIPTEEELGRAAWFDPMNLREKFQIFIIIMSINYFGLKLIFRMAVLKKYFKRKLRARKVAPEIHY